MTKKVKTVIYTSSLHPNRPIPKQYFGNIPIVEDWDNQTWTIEEFIQKIRDIAEPLYEKGYGNIEIQAYSESGYYDEYPTSMLRINYEINETEEEFQARVKEWEEVQADLKKKKAKQAKEALEKRQQVEYETYLKLKGKYEK